MPIGSWLVPMATALVVDQPVLWVEEPEPADAVSLQDKIRRHLRCLNPKVTVTCRAVEAGAKMPLGWVTVSSGPVGQRT